jgi:phosphatidylglycerophosphatase C
MWSQAPAERSADRRIAVFDLDGTLTRNDTLLPYLRRFVLNRPSRWLRIVRFAVAALGWWTHPLRRDRIKEGLIIACVGGVSRSEVNRHTQRFVDRLCANGLNASAVAELQRHRDNGDRLVLLSASPDVYVAAVADRLGFDDCVSTELSWRGDRLTGAFSSPNRRGPEKARVIERLRQTGREIDAYANSASDLAHLRLADRGVLVNGSATARRTARKHGIVCVDWR